MGRETGRLRASSVKGLVEAMAEEVKRNGEIEDIDVAMRY